VWTLEWIMKFHVGNSLFRFCAGAWGGSCEFGGGGHLVCHEFSTGFRGTPDAVVVTLIDGCLLNPMDFGGIC
jgi:hypothetical protein